MLLLEEKWAVILMVPVDSQEAAFARFLKGLEHDFRGHGEFLPHVDVSQVRAYRVAGDDHPFNELLIQPL